MGFAAAVGLFALVVAYFAFSKTTIGVTVAPEDITVTFPVHLTGEEPDPEQRGILTVSGIVRSSSATVEKHITTFQTTTAKSARASGTVTIRNTWSRPQPLAATTRLLSESGVLFRTAERVDVPAGGTVTATVTADAAGSVGNVAPGRFTIPGLSRDLQERIYATSEEAMTGGLQTVSILTEADLATASAAAEEEARAKLADLLTEPDPGSLFAVSPETVTVTETSRTASANPGDAVSEVTVTVIVKGVGVGFADEEVKTYAVERLRGKTEDGEQLLEGTPTMSYEVRDPNESDQTATIDVSATHDKTVTAEHPSFRPEQFTGKTREELQTALEQLPNIQKVNILLSPPWSRKTPRLADRITVSVETQR